MSSLTDRPAPLTTAHPAQDPADHQSSVERTVWQYLGTGISAGIFALMLGLAALVIGLPAAVVGMPLTVLSASMEPLYAPGDLVIVKPTAAKDIEVGDVITYQLRSGDPTRITHRVIDRSTAANGTTTFGTQGDANTAADERQVTEVQILGTVWYHIPGLGWINTLLTGGTRQWLIPAVAAGLFLYAVATFTAYLRERKSTPTATATIQDETRA